MEYQLVWKNIIILQVIAVSLSQFFSAFERLMSIPGYMSDPFFNEYCFALLVNIFFIRILYIQYASNHENTFNSYERLEL